MIEVFHEAGAELYSKPFIWPPRPEHVGTLKNPLAFPRPVITGTGTMTNPSITSLNCIEIYCPEPVKYGSKKLTMSGSVNKDSTLSSTEPLDNRSRKLV